MAARKLRLFHTDEIRQKIQASQLVNRLTDHAFGKVDLTPAQVQSIRILLGKSIPDLSSVQLTGSGADGEHVHRIVRDVVDPANPDG